MVYYQMFIWYNYTRKKKMVQRKPAAIQPLSFKNRLYQSQQKGTCICATANQVQSLTEAYGSLNLG